MSEKQKQKTKPPDGGYGWFIVFGAALTHFFLVGLARTLGMVYVDLRIKFGGGAAETAWVAAIFNTCRSLFAPVFSLLSERFSCRLVTICGGILMCVGFLSSAFSPNLFYLYITFGITGIGGAMVFTPAYIMVGEYFDKKKGIAMGLATIGSGLGSIVLAPLVAFLLNFYSFFGTMILFGGIELHHLIAGTIYTPLNAGHKKNSIVKVVSEKMVNTTTSIALEQKSANTIGDGQDLNSSHLHAPKGIASTDHGDDSQIDLKKENKEVAVDENGRRKIQCKISNWCCASTSLYRNVTFYLYGYLIMSMQVCIQSFLIFLPGYCMEKGADDVGAALALSIFGFLDMAGRFIFGFLFDVKYISSRRRDFYCVISFLFGICAMSLTFMPNFVSVCIMSGLTGLFEGATHSQRATVLSDFISKSQLSSAVGFIIFCQGIGNIWGPPFAGYLRDISGTNAYGFIFCGSVMCSAALVFFLEKRFRGCIG